MGGAGGRSRGNRAWEAEGGGKRGSEWLGRGLGVVCTFVRQQWECRGVGAVSLTRRTKGRKEEGKEDG